MRIDEYGEGVKTIILIHGGPSLFGYMRSLGEELSSHYKIVDYAQRGTVESPSDAKVSIESHINDLKLIIDKYSTKGKVVLIGHSWGANLGLLTVAKHPNLVEKLVLIGNAALNENISKIHGDTLNARYTEEVKNKLDQIETRLEEFKTDKERNSIMQERLALTSPFYHLDFKTEEKVPKCNWNFTTFLESIDSIWDLIDEDKVTEELAKIKDQVVAFHGDSDPIPSQETFIYLEENVPSIKTILIKESGHFPWLEVTSRVNFLKSLIVELHT